MSIHAKTFDGVSGSVAVVRGWVVELLREAGCDPEAVETARGVVSELVTNALVHTASGRAGGTVRLEVLAGVQRARITVIDAGTTSSAPMVPRTCPEPDRPNAPRGLYLVDLWAERLGAHGGTEGRIVFADIATPATRPHQDDARPAELPVRTPRRWPVGVWRQGHS